MAIDANVISKAVFDLPVQPLFNTIYDATLKAGIPVIITNTNNALKVTAKANVGSVAQCEDITDEMFTSNKSNLEVDGYLLTKNKYFTLLDLDCDVVSIPNEMRNDAAGLTDAAFMEILQVIGNRFSEQLITNLQTNLAAQLSALTPDGNIQWNMAGKIQWNTVEAAAEGQKTLAQVLDDMIGALPPTMLPGGTAGDIVVAWVSPKDFLTAANSVTQAFQPHMNGGLSSNYFQYVKEESTIGETRNIQRFQFLRYKNVIILPWLTLQPDSIVMTYEEGIEDARVFVDRVQARIKNNLYIVLQGRFVRNDSFRIPIEETARAAFDIPYQVGNLLAINKVENAELQFKIIGSFASGILLRENDKVWAVFPGTKPTAPTPSV